MPQRTQAVADVLTFPARGVASGVGSPTVGCVDDWGRDAALTDRVASICGLRWSVDVRGAEHVPADSGALIVVNARRFALAPVFAAMSIGRALGRPVRFVGRTDVAPLGPLSQRCGGLLPLPDEVAGALRAGELVVLGARHSLSNSRAGSVDRAMVGAAVTEGVRVVPAATWSSPVARAARVEIGPAVQTARRRRGPLAEFDLVDAVERRIGELLACGAR